MRSWWPHPEVSDLRVTLATCYPVRFELVCVKTRINSLCLLCWNKASLHWAAAVLWWDTSSELAKWSTGSSAESAWNIFLISQLLQHPVNGAVRWGTYACNTSFQQAHLVSLTLIFHCILPVAGVSYRLKQSPELPKRVFSPPKLSFCSRFCNQVCQMNQLEDGVSVKILPIFLALSSCLCGHWYCTIMVTLNQLQFFRSGNALYVLLWLETAQTKCNNKLHRSSLGGSKSYCLATRPISFLVLHITQWFFSPKLRLLCLLLAIEVGLNDFLK